MIKIYSKLWYVKRGDDLAYMTYYEKNKACEKRQETGRTWATRYWDRNIGKWVEAESPEFIVDNKPQSGFQIIGDVQRWVTEAKYFQIRDPRGFEVQIPTGNLSALIQMTTIENGTILAHCVWGREGQQHVLLPVNSEPYLQSLEDMYVLKNELIKPKDLSRFTWVETFEGKKLFFAGRARLTWRNDETRERVTDSWTWLFLAPHWRDENKFSIASPSVKVIKQLRDLSVPTRPIIELIDDYPPKRVLNNFDEIGRDKVFNSYTGWRHDDMSVVSIQYKE